MLIIVCDGSTQKSLLYLSDVVDQNLWFHTKVVIFTVINHYMMQHVGLKRKVSLGVENMSMMVPHRNHYCICQMLLIKISGSTQKSLLYSL